VPDEGAVRLRPVVMREKVDEVVVNVEDVLDDA
jgi:hypothetical protein